MWTTILQIGELVDTAQRVSMSEPYVYSDELLLYYYLLLLLLLIININRIKILTEV